MHKILKVDGIEYKLRLSINALSDFKMLNGGKGVVRALEYGELEFDEIRALFHVALICGNEDYENDLKDTGDLMQQYLDEYKKGYEALGKLIGEVVTLALGKQKQKKTSSVPKQIPQIK